MEIEVAAKPDRAKRIESPKTPWQRAYAHFGFGVNQLAEQLETSASIVSRSIRDEDGLIGGKMQKKMIELGKRIGREVSPTDLLPL